MDIEKVVGPAIMEACDSLEVKKKHDPLELDNKIFEVKKEFEEPQLETIGKDILVNLSCIFIFSLFNSRKCKIFYLSFNCSNIRTSYLILNIVFRTLIRE